MELKLTQVARASLEELLLDYEDYLRHRALPQWEPDDPRRAALVARRCATAEEVAAWVKEVHGRDGQQGQDGCGDLGGVSMPSTQFMESIQSGQRRRRPTYPELAANAAHVLIGVASALLDRQIKAQAAAFENEGGFTERLHRIRSERRRRGPS